MVFKSQNTSSDQEETLSGPIVYNFSFIGPSYSDIVVKIFIGSDQRTFCRLSKHNRHSKTAHTEMKWGGFCSPSSKPTVRSCLGTPKQAFTYCSMWESNPRCPRQVITVTTRLPSTTLSDILHVSPTDSCHATRPTSSLLEYIHSYKFET